MDDYYKSEWNIMDPELSNLPDISRFLEDASKSFQGRNKTVNYLIKSVIKSK